MSLPLRRLLPAAAQRLIDLHEPERLLQFESGQRQLALEQVTLGVQHLQVTVPAALIAESREAGGLGQRIDEQLLFGPLPARVVVTAIASDTSRKAL